MKRYLLLFICLVLCFAGCGKTTEEEVLEKENEITKEVQEEDVSEDVNVPEKDVVSRDEDVYFYDFYDDLIVSFEGANGIGRLKYEYIGDYTGYSMEVSLDCSKKDGLSNGDVVTITPSNLIEKHYRRKGGGLSSPSKNYVVSGLPEAETFDAFKGLQVMFDNISPCVCVDVDNTRTIHPILDYEIRKQDGTRLLPWDEVLENGEEIIVSITNNSARECYEQFGEVPESLVKTYKVEGMPHYYLSFDDVTEDCWNVLIDDSKEALLSLWGNREVVKEIRYIGKSICVSDDFYHGVGIDYLNMYYEITAQYPGGEEFKYYTYQGYTDTYYNPEDNLVYINYLYNSLYSGFTMDDIWYRGYQTLNELYDDNIHPYREKSGYSFEYEFEPGFEYEFGYE